MKKYLITLFIGFAVFLIGIAYFYIETLNYSVDSNLTSNFNFEQEVIEYEINNNETVVITNDNTNKNMSLFIDNSLSNEIRIVVVHPDIIEINSKYNTKEYNNNQSITVNLNSDLIINLDNLSVLYDLGILSFKNKTLYNYTLLEYPEIRVYVNENYRSNVKFINNYGKTYNPIR